MVGWEPKSPGAIVTDGPGRGHYLKEQVCDVSKNSTTPARPVIDPELSGIIPPLAAAELERLEANLLADGCRDPLVVWRGVLLDGHNRLAICERHGIPYTTVSVELPDKAAAMDWMLRNQLGRRNLTREQFTVLLGRRYKLRKKAVGERGPAKSGQNDPASGHATAEAIAAEHGVSEATVRRAAKAVDALPDVSPAEQAELLRAARELKRRHYLARYGSEFTVRWSRPSGVPTEIDKIREGLVDYIFYGFVSPDESRIVRYFVGDLARFRLAEPKPLCIRENTPPDSKLAVYRVGDMDDHFIVKSYPDGWAEATVRARRSVTMEGELL